MIIDIGSLDKDHKMKISLYEGERVVETREIDFSSFIIEKRGISNAGVIHNSAEYHAQMIDYVACKIRNSIVGLEVSPIPRST